MMAKQRVSGLRQVEIAVVRQADGGEVMDDTAILKVMYDTLPDRAIKAMTLTSWKDGIDITVLTCEAKAFVEALLSDNRAQKGGEG
jgi:hypothetical protein